MWVITAARSGRFDRLGDGDFVHAIGRHIDGDGADPPGQRLAPFIGHIRDHDLGAHLDMVDQDLGGGKAYSVTVMDNFSRAILTSAVTRRQDLSAFLSVFYRAVARYGAPGMLVTDSGSVFLSNRSRAVYAKLGVNKEEIEKGRPWQNYLETAFNVQKRMADWRF